MVQRCASAPARQRPSSAEVPEGRQAPSVRAPRVSGREPEEPGAGQGQQEQRAGRVPHSAGRQAPHPGRALRCPAPERAWRCREREPADRQQVLLQQVPAWWLRRVPALRLPWRALRVRPALLAVRHQERVWIQEQRQQAPSKHPAWAPQAPELQASAQQPAWGPRPPASALRRRAFQPASVRWVSVPLLRAFPQASARQQAWVLPRQASGPAAQPFRPAAGRLHRAPAGVSSQA